MIIDFDCEISASINSLAVNKNREVKLTMRVFAGKMLMFPKLSLMSFIYDVVETFYIPNLKTKMIYHSYAIEKILLYHILNDTDSTSLLFHIISEPGSSIPDDKCRDVIFEFICQNKIISRFDTSHE